MGLLRYVMLTGAVLSCCSVLSAKEITARLNYRICVPDQPAKIETMAAKELASYLERTYTEKIRMNGSDAPILFSVGFAPEAKEFNKAIETYEIAQQLKDDPVFDDKIRSCHIGIGDKYYNDGGNCN